eukprot:TRINITY_DN406_c0_g1_i2.p1 TRINITY_DN406_c0_g1~~TRINITY_DN406_c0_g1_i2.p1  ORF type:complete len:137 (+),score=23.71 TRINITY_DN406_c0_g1_i2:333-743(+)
MEWNTTTPQPTESNTTEPDSWCTNLQLPSGMPWHDADGPRYGCSWYAAHQRCMRFGRSYRNHHVAQEACCVCGGGSSDVVTPSSPPSPDNTTYPTYPNWTEAGSWNTTAPMEWNTTAPQSAEWNTTEPAEFTEYAE